MTQENAAAAGGRRASLERETGETRVTVELDVDGSGAASASTGVGFLDHMVEAFARHGRFDLDVRAEGDLEVDAHHTMEDVALALGQAFDGALGERAGIVRMGDATVPLDEALVHVAIDLSGRPYAAVDLEFTGSGSARHRPSSSLTCSAPSPWAPGRRCTYDSSPAPTTTTSPRRR